jgi:hypothetical protein
MKEESKSDKFWIRIETGTPDKSGQERFAMTLRPNGYHQSPRKLDPMALSLGRTFETEEVAMRKAWHLFGVPTFTASSVGGGHAKTKV